MPIPTLFTNRSSHKDFLKNAFLLNNHRPQDLYIASAFFTDEESLCELAEKGHRIRLIVRLGFPTNPSALKKSLESDMIDIRFFTSGSFHPKLYLFEDFALVGSANFTRSGLLTNQEITVTIPREDKRYDSLQDLFGEYWDDAVVLTEVLLGKYERLYNKRDFSENEKLKEDVKEQIGSYTASNIDRGKAKKDSKTLFLDNYRKVYQECTTAFRQVAAVYEKIGRRKFGDETIPFNLEVDAFLDFIRRKHAVGETWKDAKLLSGEAQKDKIRKYVLEWLDIHWEYFETTVVYEKYPAIRKSLGTEDSIETLPLDEILKGLSTVHSLENRRMHFKGGLDTLLNVFTESNGEDRIRTSLKYLLHGEDDIVERMYALNNNPDYKLQQFGKSNIQEIVGWIHPDIPIVNGRTTKVLKFLGFDIRQIGESWS